MVMAANLNTIAVRTVSGKGGEKRGCYAPSADAEPSAVLFAQLKQKQRRIRSAFPEHVGLRIHRALSWLGRADAEDADPDVRFILLWIGFNSAYAAEPHNEPASERGAFNAYFELLVGLDREHRIYSSVWERFSQEIRLLLDNPYVFAPFWNHHNGLDGYADWESRLASSQKVIARAMAERETAKILSRCSIGSMSCAIS
jgi:hypothetical protein